MLLPMETISLHLLHFTNDFSIHGFYQDQFVGSCFFRSVRCVPSQGYLRRIRRRASKSKDNRDTDCECAKVRVAVMVPKSVKRFSTKVFVDQTSWKAQNSSFKSCSVNFSRFPMRDGLPKSVMIQVEGIDCSDLNDCRPAITQSLFRKGNASNDIDPSVSDSLKTCRASVMPSGLAL